MGKQYSLKLVDGDIAIRGDGNATVVSGRERIAQDLSCWCLEPIGSDPMYPGFGSDLSSRIGEVNSRLQHQQVVSEVSRVCANYVAYQQRQLAEVSAASYMSNWSEDDIVSSIRNVSAKSSRDTIEVDVDVTTVAGEEFGFVQVI